MHEGEVEPGSLSDVEEMFSDELDDDAPEPPLHSREELAQAQADDPFCRRLRRYMELAEEDGPLWLKRFQPFDDDGLLCVCLRGSKPMVVLPESLKERVIFNHHLSYYAGHFVTRH